MYSGLNSQQAVEAAVAAVSSNAQYQSHGAHGVPIPPPLVPNEGESHPLPPARSTSSTGGQRSRGKRSRHAGTSSRNNPGDIHYPKYDYGQQQHYKYGNTECQYTTKYGEDCR